MEEDDTSICEDDRDLLDPTVSKPRRRSGARRRGWSGPLLFSLCLVAGTALLLGAGFGAGFLAARTIYNAPEQRNGSCSATNTSNTTGAEPDWGGNVTAGGGKSVPVTKWLDTALDPDNIRKNLQLLTEKPHIAGNTSDMNVARLIYDSWTGYNFDKVEETNYSVLLQYPGNQSRPNRLELRNSAGEVVYQAAIQQEKPLLPQERDPSVAPPFNAYSGSGNASGPLVYVNYGSLDDFLYLNTTLNISLEGHVCIIRYGNIYRGDKAYLAEENGCVAVILYSDPADYAPRPGPAFFPNGTSLPPSGVQRGSLLRSDGDPQTPGVPSIPGVHRRSYDEAVDKGFVPSIPVQPLSSEDAIHFMRQLTELPAPGNWTGQLPNLSTYYILQSQNNTNETYLEVNNYLVTKNITNVIATIYGRVEPDRYVLLGNHHDAWTFGAADPNSGTAALMELARALSDLRSKKWRPGRTIILCSWDAEEYGLIGSYEWTEEYAKILAANAVAYLNVDTAVDGTFSFDAQATPLLIQAIYTATKMTKCPNTTFDTVYDEWLFRQNKSSEDVPEVAGLGSGSDFTSFLQGLGITCSDIYYEYFDPIGYPVYHSVHDNFYYEANLTDPTFSHHTAIGLVWGKIALLLATSPVLPFDPRDYSAALSNIFKNLEEDYGSLLAAQNISLDYLSHGIDDFEDSAKSLWAELQKVLADPSDLSLVRRLNYQLMQLERAFIVPEGLPGRPFYKHVVYAPSSVNQYGSSLFPGVTDAIFSALNWGASWDVVRDQLDLVRIHILYATQIMAQYYESDDSSFWLKERRTRYSSPNCSQSEN